MFMSEVFQQKLYVITIMEHLMRMKVLKRIFCLFVCLFVFTSERKLWTKIKKDVLKSSLLFLPIVFKLKKIF